MYVEPKLVVEIAFNEIQVSPRYASGLALRFARVKRYRTDKTAAESRYLRDRAEAGGRGMTGAKPVALTIAGSDASGGAGIQADLKIFHQFGVYGEAVITLITVQNTCGVQRVECLAADLVADQIRAVMDDIPPAAAKTGALGNRAIIEAVAAVGRGTFAFPLVVDPVLVSKNGTALVAPDAVEAFEDTAAAAGVSADSQPGRGGLSDGAGGSGRRRDARGGAEAGGDGTASRAHKGRAPLW